MATADDSGDNKGCDHQRTTVNRMWRVRITLVPPAWAGPGAVCHVLLPTRFARRAEAVLAGQCLWAGPPGREIAALHIRAIAVAGPGEEVEEQSDHDGWVEVPWDHTCGAILQPDQHESGDACAVTPWSGD